MSDLPLILEQQIIAAVDVLRDGGVIAYPTEHCFGLGCDPRNQHAISKLLAIKQRQPEQGVILIAAELAQVNDYVDLSASPLLPAIEASWPGPNTWLLPALESVSTWVRGKHTTVAMRVTANKICRQLCMTFGGAIVSTSANRHGQAALLDSASVSQEMAAELDYIIDAPVDGATQPSTIRDGLTGDVIR